MSDLRAGSRAWVPWIAGAALLALATFLATTARVNTTTAGFLYLLLVLGLATWGGWAVGFAASVLATLAFNYFFFPPFHTLTIAEPANWIALGSFLLASSLVSRLVSQARQRAAEALARQREVETLYDLCFSLFTTSDTADSLGLATARTLRAIGASSGGLLTAGAAGEPAWLHKIGEAAPDLDAVAARALAAGSEIGENGPAGTTTRALPLPFAGTAPTFLVARGPLASPAVVASAVRLLALACERERLLSEAAHLEATRQSERLKTALLRAVSHDLRTPLTGMRLFADSLERQLAGRPAELDSLHGLVLEQERLRRRIDNLLALARLEAGVAHPHREPSPAAALIASARESLGPILAARRLEVAIAPGCPELDADPSLTLEILVNLLENAVRSASPEEPIEIHARPAGYGSDEMSRASEVWIEVCDRGPGMPAAIRWRLGEPSGLARAAAGEGSGGGLGLEIARAFTEAQGGKLTFLDRPGGGTIARVALPAVAEPAGEAT